MAEAVYCRCEDLALLHQPQLERPIPPRTTQAALGTLAALAAGCTLVALLSYTTPEAGPHAPALALATSGAVYWALGQVLTLCARLAESARAEGGRTRGLCANNASAPPPPLASATAAPAALSAQPALCNHAAGRPEAAAAWHRLRHGGAAAGGAAFWLEPGSHMGRELLGLLEARRAEAQAAEAAAGAAPEGAAAGALGAAALHAAAFPGTSALLARVAGDFAGVSARIWLVPFTALNPEGCPPQFYSLAAAAALVNPGQRGGGEGLDVFVASDLGPAGWPPEAGGGGELHAEAPSEALQRVAGALVAATCQVGVRPAVLELSGLINVPAALGTH